MTGRDFSVQLPATRRGAHRARTLATAHLRTWQLPPATCDAAAHIVAELAANAAIHGRVPGRDFRLTLTARGGTPVLRIEVTDARGDRLPTTSRPGAGDTESGRGLLLVTALSSRWGVTSGPIPCKTVWAEIDLPAGP